MECIKIVIDRDVLDKYYEEYFEKYSRRKKKPIDRPFPPSLNRFIAMKRIQQNDIKQKYKEFSIWLASFYKIANLHLDKAKIIYQFYFQDRRRRDMDNLVLTPKFFQDGFVVAGVLVDDSGDILEIEFGSFKYDRINPRVEIIIECNHDKTCL
jgi:Holliday junction resolvase RusA-like endonuclease